MRALTLVLPCFCNLGMLAEHQKVWADYPADLGAQLHAIVVDDCSPKERDRRITARSNLQRQQHEFN